MFLGPLHFHRPFKISLYPDRRAWWHGGVILYPVVTERLRARGIAMVFAGPSANLLTGCAVLLLPTPVGFYSGLFVITSILAGTIELLLPLRGATFTFDGRRILMMLRDRAAGERWLALMRLGAEARGGVMPESMSRDFLARATAVRDNSGDTLMAHWLAYSAAFHRHDDAEAGRMLEVSLSCAAQASPAIREGLASDAAVFQARRGRRADLAEQWLADMPASPQVSWLRSRAEAALLEARGDVVGALRKLDETERAIGTLPNPGQRELLLPLLNRWKAELRVVS
jgi:hypothetical protein